MPRGTDPPLRESTRPLLSLTGVGLSVVLYVEALRPSLLPRSSITQILLGALALVIGYALGALVGGIARRLVPSPPRPLPLPALLVAVGAGILIAAVFTAIRLPWQEGQRAMLGMDVSAPPLLRALLGSLAVALTILMAGRGMRRLVTRIESPLESRALAWAVVGGTLCALVVAVVVGARAVFDNLDGGTDDRPPPTSPLRSGGPGSLVPWETLGDRGRRFVTGGPSGEEIAAVTGATSKESIRAYVGLDSAPTVRERADLLIDELERTGAFDRSAIVLFTPAGPGFVNPVAVDSVEYLLGGDVASAAVQYSTAPSFLSVVMDGDAASESSRESFDAIREAIDARPAADRPHLFVFGESLGALGSQAPFAGGDSEDLEERIDGALWIGPPAASAFRADLMQEAAGPEWEPVVDDGRIVRFGAEAERLSDLHGPWGPARAAFVQHATDPVVWFDPVVLFSRPGWLEQPRGPGVDDRMQWRPLVTFAQLLLDLTVAREAPDGVGHRYTSDVVRAWVEVLEPEGWTDVHTDGLLEVMLAG